MQTLYAVQMDVAPAASDLPDVLAIMRDYTAGWLGRGTTELIDVGALGSPGQRKVATTAGVERAISWDVADSLEVRAIRIEQLETRNDEPAIRSVITLAESNDGSGQFRVEIGLVTTGGRIAPVVPPEMHRPGIVGRLLGDKRLRCSVQGQLVDVRYDLIRDVAHAAVLADVADSANRLPLVVVNTSWQSTWLTRADRVRGLASELAGLARVAALSHATSVAELRRRGAAWTPAPDHGVLLWPGAPDQQVPFALADLGESGYGGLVQLVSQASAVSYGADRIWADARAARNRVAHRLPSRRPAVDPADDAYLMHSDGSNLVVPRLKRELVELKARYDSQSEWVAELEKENERLTADERAAKEQVVELKSERFRLKAMISARYATLPAEPGAGDLETLIEEILSAPTPDVAQAMTQLQEAAGGALVFTPAAHHSWTAITFHAPDDMLRNLCQLARVAVDWRTVNGKPGLGLEQWLKANGFPSCAVKDEALQDKKLHLFQYEGRQYDQTPHIKLGENTRPDRVGRIYFDALNSDPARFVVNHVGLKLYGI